jgi:hypothetical protein
LLTDLFAQRSLRRYLADSGEIEALAPAPGKAPVATTTAAPAAAPTLATAEPTPIDAAVIEPPGTPTHAKGEGA